MNKRRICALLLSGVIAVSAFGCSSSGTDAGSQSTEGESATTTQSDSTSESLKEQETTTMDTEAETSETTVATTFTEPTETTQTIEASIDDYFNAITNDYFYFDAMLEINNDIINSRGSLGESGCFNIYEFKSTEGLKVGDKVTILSTSPGEESKELEYTIAAINGQYVLIAYEWGTVPENQQAPYAIPELQSVYDAFIAFEG